MCIYIYTLYIYIYIYIYILQHIQTRESHTTCLFVSLLTSNLAKNSSRSKCLVGTQSTLGLPPCFVQRPGSFWGDCVIITSVSRLSKNRSSRLLKLVLCFWLHHVASTKTCLSCLKQENHSHSKGLDRVHDVTQSCMVTLLGQLFQLESRPKIHSA